METNDEISVLIADDEPPARRGLRALVEAHADLHVVGEARSGRETVAAIHRLQPDVVFLDVQMPEGDGFEVIRSVGADRMPVVVFATAFDEYALRAFEAHAFDYLLKPYERERFETIVGRLRARVRQTRGGSLDPRLLSFMRRMEGHAGYLRRISVRIGSRVRLVNVDTVDYLEADDNYVRIHTSENSYLYRGTLAGLEVELDPALFTRVHRSLIVNVERVLEVEPLFAGEHVLTLHSGVKLTTGRTYRTRVQAAFGLRA